jgi:hypothetical protein
VSLEYLRVSTAIYKQEPSRISYYDNKSRNMKTAMLQLLEGITVGYMFFPSFVALVHKKTVVPRVYLI